MLNHITAPVADICKSLTWLQDALTVNLNPIDKWVVDTIDLIERELMHYSIKDFENLYETITPKWSCGSMPFDDYYLSLKESVEVADKLLLAQNGDDIDNICNFMETLRTILDKDPSSRKRNCVVLIGPPSCGKTYFIEHIAQFFINKGGISICYK